jgi:hypothetical protein
MKKTTLEYRMMQEHNRHKVPDSKLLSGSLIGLYPVTLDGGRTTIFIDDKSKEQETRDRYQQRKDNKLNYFVKKPKVPPVVILKQALTSIPVTHNVL